MKRHARTVGNFLFCLAIFNFIAFAFGTAAVGGSALNGKVENGRFYVGNHGRMTEVSRGVWIYSRIHSISMVTTHLVGIVVGGGLLTYANKSDERGK